VECVYETEDEQNLTGVRLSKDIVEVAGRAMEKNFTALGEPLHSTSIPWNVM
jgi:hypothetical protein